ncbi:MAG: N-acetylmuramoyl-L-alanine amidase [Coriobacteriia bacterium]|nr:N-acetylmuramoyl-L-alanine amidase [Coriobacteriia bacterium]
MNPDAGAPSDAIARAPRAPAGPLAAPRLAMLGFATAAVLALAAALPPSVAAAHVYIDPGHGGPYSNANANGLQEKDVNLAIAEALRDELRARGHKVGMTRTRDGAVATKDRPTWNWSDAGGWRFYADGTTRYTNGVPKDDLQARCDKANTAGADIFVSIHNNGASSSSAHGTETYASPKDPLGRRLCGLVQEEVVKATGLRDRGAFTAEYYVVRWTNMPAVLVEGGFITNSGDARKLADPAFRRKLARGIARGVARFLDSRPFERVYPRLSGPDRYATAAAVSAAGWPGGASTVLLTSGTDWPDAMAAAPLSKRLDAPLLLTAPGSLSPAARDEIARLRPSDLVVLGSSAAVSDRALAQARAAAGLAPDAVRRIGGRDRYQTAALIADELGVPSDGRVVLVSGTALVDALSIVAEASRRGWPIVLTKRDELPGPTASFFSRNSTSTVSTLVVGGPPVVAAAPLAGLPAVERLSGPDRYRTNVAVFRKYYAQGRVAPMVVNGAASPDGLVAAAYGAKTGRPVILTGGRFLSPYTREWIAQNRTRLDGHTVVGGPPVVPYLMDWMLVKSAAG